MTKDTRKEEEERKDTVRYSIAWYDIPEQTLGISIPILFRLMSIWVYGIWYMYLSGKSNIHVKWKTKRVMWCDTKFPTRIRSTKENKKKTLRFVHRHEEMSYQYQLTGLQLYAVSGDMRIKEKMSREGRKREGEGEIKKEKIKKCQEGRKGKENCYSSIRPKTPSSSSSAGAGRLPKSTSALRFCRDVRSASPMRASRSSETL